MKKTLSLIALIFLAAFAFGQLGTVSVKTADYALLPADHGTIIVVNSASARTVYLPGPSPSQIGFTVTIQKRGAGNVTIQAAAADYIADSGVGQYIRNTTATETYASITLVYTQANRWQIQAASGTWSTDTSSMKFGADTVAALALKAPLASPSFTGTVTLPTGLTGYAKATAGVVSAGAIADGDLPASIKGTKIFAAAEADFDIDEVKATGVTLGYGLLEVAETSGKLMGLFRLDGDAVVSVSANSTFSITKDTGSKINVYYETDQVKVQNKISTGAMEAVAVVAAGADYLVGDVLTVADGSSGTVTVATIGGDAHVDTATLSAAGLGYDIAVHPTSYAGAGTGCTIDVTAVDGGDGHIDTWTIAAGGLGYSISDVLDVGGTGAGATITVTAIDKGHVTGVTLTAAGSGYTIATHATTGGTGTGCTIAVSAIVGLALKVAYFGIY